MNRGMQIAAYIGLLALWGCGGPVISKALREEATPITGFGQVRQNPEQFKNQTIIVGGTIIATVNHANDTTTLIVLDHPLGYRDRPRESDLGQGRFLAEVSRFLDPEVFSRGREVTVAGAVQGVRTAPVGEAQYAYVVLEARQVYLWPRESPYVYAYPYWDYYWGWGPRFYYGEGFEGGRERERHERREGAEPGEREREGGERRDRRSPE